MLLGAGSAIIATSSGQTLDNVNNVITGQGTIGAGGSGNTDLTLKNESAGTIDANVATKTLTIDTGNTISNAGLLEATNTATLDIQDAVNNSGLLQASDGSTLDITGNTISWVGAAAGIAGTNGIDLVGSGDTLLVDAASKTLTLNGSTAGGAVLLGAGSAIIATSSGQTLDNVNNVITGQGTIGAGGSGNTDLTLKNESAGTIDANVATKTLTIDTGNTISNAGLLEATNTATLDIQDAVNNSGLLQASDGSTLDITGNTISWVGAAAGIAGTNGIDLVGSGDTLLVDAASKTLTLNGSTAGGAVLLGAGSAIIATSSGQTLDNVNNVITGQGTIGAGGSGNTDLTLKNESAGTIDANVATKTLTIDTGNTISNAGLLEATNTATLDIQDAVNNSGLLQASDGSTLDITGNTISWVGAAAGIAGTNGIDLVGSGDTLLVDAASKTLTLNGSTAGGAVLLGAGSAIIATSSGQTLDNVNNVITGQGTIGAGGSGNTDLTLKNESAGTIDANVATKTLTIDTGNTISNAGLLEATAGGILDVKDALSNSDDVTASGSGSKVTLEGNVTNTGGTLLATGGGELDVKAATITDNLDGTEQINTGSELLVDSSHLTLNGDGTGQVVLSGTALITGASELENVNKTISGAGTISDLTLVNDSAGVVDANVAGETLTIETTNTVSNAGLMEANGGALTIDATPMTNTGTLEAIDDSTLTLLSDNVTNIGGTVEVAPGSLLNFDGSGITGGTVDVYGTLDFDRDELDRRR